MYTYAHNPRFGGFNLSDHWVDGVFGRRLGAPLTDATYDPVHSRWRRSFGSGTEVEFRLAQDGTFGTGTIVWGNGTR